MIGIPGIPIAALLLAESFDGRRRGWLIRSTAHLTWLSLAAMAAYLAVAVPRAGGFGLLNLRAGKRAGLHSVVFVEAVNLLDKQHEILNVQQPGRQLRFGVTQRF